MPSRVRDGLVDGLPRRRLEGGCGRHPRSSRMQSTSLPAGERPVALRDPDQCVGPPVCPDVVAAGGRQQLDAVDAMVGRENRVPIGLPCAGARPREPSSAVTRSGPGWAAPSRRSRACLTKTWKQTEAETGFPGRPNQSRSPAAPECDRFARPDRDAVEQRRKALAGGLGRNEVEVARRNASRREQDIELAPGRGSKQPREAGSVIRETPQELGSRRRVRQRAASMWPFESRIWPGPGLSDAATSSLPVTAIPTRGFR